jgi:hypothetical protein
MAETRTPSDQHNHDDNHHRSRETAMSKANTTKTKTRAKSRRSDGPSAEELLVADLVALMESNDLPPWRREWSGHHGEHRNLETGQQYRGANPILL